MKVYYVHAPELGLVKIGYARNPSLRFANLQSASPTRLVLLAMEDGGLAVETARHRQFRELQVRGEWFRYEGDLEEFAATLSPCAATPQREPKLDTPLWQWLNLNRRKIAEFAKEVGISSSGMHAIASGRKMPRHDVVLRIACITNSEIDELALLRGRNLFLARERRAA